MSKQFATLHTALCAYTHFLTKTPDVFPVVVPYIMYTPLSLAYARVSFVFIYISQQRPPTPQAISQHIDVDIMAHRHYIPDYYLCYLNP